MAGRKTMVGLDIGRHSIKAVWMKLVEGKPVITRTELFKLPMTEKLDPTAVAQWIQKVGLTGTSCVIGIPARDTIFQPLNVLRADPRGMDQVAAMEVIRFNEMASDTMVHDYAPFSMAEDDRRFLLAIATPSVINDHMTRARTIGLEIEEITPLPVALFGLLNKTQTEEKKVTAFVDIGHTATSIAIGRPNHLMFARSFPSGGALFTAAIAEKRNCSSSQAENLKTSEANLLAASPDFQTLSAVATAWITELVSCFSVFSNLLPAMEARPTRIVLSGGASLLPGFRELIASRMQLPVVPPDPLPGMPRDPQAPALFANAAGLAASGISEEYPTRISLLPEADRTELIFRKNRPFWIASGIAAVLILVLSFAGGYIDLQRKKTVQRKQKTELDQRQAIASEIEMVKNKTEILRKMAQPLVHLARPASALKKVLVLLSSIKQDTESIVLVCDADAYYHPALISGATPHLRHERNRSAVSSANGTQTTNLVNSLIIEGYTRDASLRNVKTLIASLNEADFIKSADLLNDDKMPPLDPQETPPRDDAIRFAVEIVLENSF